MEQLARCHSIIFLKNCTIKWHQGQNQSVFKVSFSLDLKWDTGNNICFQKDII